MKGHEPERDLKSASYKVSSTTSQKVRQLLHIHAANPTIVNTNRNSIPCPKSSFRQCPIPLNLSNGPSAWSFVPSMPFQPSPDIVPVARDRDRLGLMLLPLCLPSPSGRGATCTFKPSWPGRVRRKDNFDIKDNSIITNHKYQKNKLISI